jgi:hypothetical protein
MSVGLPQCLVSKKMPRAAEARKPWAVVAGQMTMGLCKLVTSLGGSPSLPCDLSLSVLSSQNRHVCCLPSLFAKVITLGVSSHYAPNKALL